MADYRTITDAEVDPDAPLTSSLGYAWRDNPIAIAEGAVGAPKVMGQALGAMIALKQPAPLIITDLERAEVLIVWGEWETASSSLTVTFRVETSTDGGVSWSPVVDLNEDTTESRQVRSFSAPVDVSGNVNAVRLTLDSSSGGSPSNPLVSAACLQGVSP